jgi:hypothetical protein
MDHPNIAKVLDAGMIKFDQHLLHYSRLTMPDGHAATIRRQCARFVLDNHTANAAAYPAPPAGLNDRATDIWEPLLALADLAGGDWPNLARQAALALTTGAQENNPIGSLLIDIFFTFAVNDTDRLFSRDLVEALSYHRDRPWLDLTQGKTITELWLSQQLRPYGIRPRTMRKNERQAKGYFKDDCTEAFRRYIPKSEKDALLSSLTGEVTQPPKCQRRVNHSRIDPS